MPVREKPKYPESGGAYRSARYAARTSEGERVTQQRLAAQVGTDRTYINKIERGHHRPGPDLRDRIADALRVDPSTLPASADPFVISARPSLSESVSGWLRKWRKQ